MAIFIPGKRDRHGRLKAGGRSAVAVLQLTAMVDLFTVLAVFLLQNYASTGEVISMKKDIQLPSASATKKLNPSPVVLISHKEIALNQKKISNYSDVRQSKDWIIQDLQQALTALIQKEKQKHKQSQQKLHHLIKQAKNTLISSPEDRKKIKEISHKITIQADKSIDFLTIKKVIFTALESGVHEVNFAVLQSKKKTKSPFKLSSADH